MKIEALNQPIAGENFSFRVIDGTQPTRIDVYIAGSQLVSTDCADPPCHEMLFVPHNARGAEVLIIARDNFGNIEKRVFKVADKDSSAGGMMTAGA